MKLYRNGAVEGRSLPVLCCELSYTVEMITISTQASIVTLFSLISSSSTIFNNDFSFPCNIISRLIFHLSINLTEIGKH